MASVFGSTPNLSNLRSASVGDGREQAWTDAIKYVDANNKIKKE